MVAQCFAQAIVAEGVRVRVGELVAFGHEIVLRAYDGNSVLGPVASAAVLVSEDTEARGV